VLEPRERGEIVQLGDVREKSEDRSSLDRHGR